MAFPGQTHFLTKVDQIYHWGMLMYRIAFGVLGPIFKVTVGHKWPNSSQNLLCVQYLLDERSSSTWEGLGTPVFSQYLLSII